MILGANNQKACGVQASNLNALRVYQNGKLAYNNTYNEVLYKVEVGANTYVELDDFQPTSKTRVVMDASLTVKKVYQCLFGARKGGALDTFSLWLYAPNIRSDYGTSNSGAFTTPDVGVKFTVDKNRNITYLNGAVIDTKEVQTFNTDKNLLLFGNYTVNGTTDSGTVTAGGMIGESPIEIYEDDILVRWLFPIPKGDCQYSDELTAELGGYWCKVTKRYYAFKVLPAKEGSTTFTPTTTIAKYWEALDSLSRLPLPNHLTASNMLLPENVAVIYNANSADSIRLAQLYAKVRNIPAENLVSITCPVTETCTGTEYVEQILTPIRNYGIAHNWWTDGDLDPAASTVTSRTIYAILTMYGVPLKTTGSASNQYACSIDSKLAMLAYPTTTSMTSGINSPYWEATAINGIKSIKELNLRQTLVSRIDAPTALICERMITDPIKVELQGGLWGWCLVDEKGPYASGDLWQKEVATNAITTGFPTYWYSNTSVKNLPASFPLFNKLAYYSGWYTSEAYGDFIADTFNFIPGAVGVHIYSYSASTLKGAGNGWCNSLLRKGCSCTVGNVYEPYLTGSHHVDKLFDYLNKGLTWAEAAEASHGILNWHTVNLGDPLYRPFLSRTDYTVKNNFSSTNYWLLSNRYTIKTDKWYVAMFEAATASSDEILAEGLMYQAMRDLKWTDALQAYNIAVTKTTDSKTLSRLALAKTTIDSNLNK